MIKDATILVTGGLGAIGSALSRELLARGAKQLIIIDDCSSSAPETSKDVTGDARVAWINDSIVHDASLDKAFGQKPDIVFHLAANFANQNSVDNPIRDCEVNSLGTVKILDRAKKANVKKFAFASSSCVYGPATNFAITNKDLRPETPYAVDKLHGELLVEFFHRYHRMDTVTLRYFNSFGPGELPGPYRNVVPNFFALAMSGKPLPITGDGTTSRDFNYIENTVTATILAAETAGSAGRTYNVGAGSEVTIADLAKHINAITGNTAGIAWIPRRNWDSIEHRCADIRETTKDLGYKPVVDLGTQLQSTYEWLKRYAHLFPKV